MTMHFWQIIYLISFLQELWIWYPLSSAKSMGFLRWSRSQLLWLFIKHPHWQVLSTRQATGNCRCPQWFYQLQVLCLNLSYSCFHCTSFLLSYLTFCLTFYLAWIASIYYYRSSWSACKRQTHSSLACQGLKVWSLSWSAVDFKQIEELQDH